MVVMQANGVSDDPEVQDAFVRYSRCMREHGIDMPDPGADGQTRIEIDDPDAWEEAEEECRPIIEEVVGTFEPPSEEEQARMREQALEFAKCMREHGIDMPDPQFGEDGGVTINVGSRGRGRCPSSRWTRTSRPPPRSAADLVAGSSRPLNRRATDAGQVVDRDRRSSAPRPR